MVLAEPLAKDPLCVGVVGAGEIVARLHLPILKSLADVQVDWITDINERSAGLVARSFGTTAHDLPKDLRDLPAADVILLGIPYGAREPYYAALAARGVALYVEKPFARTVEEHRSRCLAWKDYSIACGFQRRSHTTVQLARSLIQSRIFGALERIEFGLGHRGQVRSGTYHSNAAAAGGGLLFEVGVHGIDALLFTAGAQDAELESASVVRLENFDVHVDATIGVKTAEGRWLPAHVVVSGLEDTIESFHFRFEHGEVRFSIFSDDVTLTVNAQGRRYRIGSDDFGHVATMYQCAYVYWKTFIDGVRNRSANWTSAHDMR